MAEGPYSDGGNRIDPDLESRVDRMTSLLVHPVGALLMLVVLMAVLLVVGLDVIGV